MGKNKKKKQETRASPLSAWLCDPGTYEALTCTGYTSLSHCPEIVAAVGTIAQLVGSMTIYLMQNTDAGDVRVKNELSRKMDIEPAKNMTRSTFVQWIVRTLYLEGNGNAVVWPRTWRGYLEDLRPVPPGWVSFTTPSPWEYAINFGGTAHNPESVLHFILNPNANYPYMGDGYRVVLKDIANNLKQAAATEKGFMESKWKPSLIVKVDALTEEFASPEGRKKLLDSYINTAQAGEPWMIPAEQFSVEQVKPLSLTDLAISDMVTLDKRTVAAILGVPAFVLGVGDFQRDAWNNFISTTIMPLAQVIEQELTKKLLISPELYFKFNSRSLYRYDLSEMVAAGATLVDHMAMRRNEWRDWIGLPPDADMDELLALENYIPQDRLGDQKKLNSDTGGDSNGNADDADQGAAGAGG